MLKNLFCNPLSDFRPVFGSNCDGGMTRKYKRQGFYGIFLFRPLIRTSFCDPLSDFRPVFQVNCDEGMTRKYKIKHDRVTKSS